MKHILIVDDDRVNLKMAQTVLCDTYKVTAVTAGEQALKFLESNLCDLVLSDICMPQMDGFDLFERIKERKECAGIPLIFLTSDNDPETERRCLEAGAMDFITKPFVPAVMKSRVGRTLELEEMRLRLADKLEQKIREVSEIRNKSQQDALTGLWNRSYTENAVNDILETGGKGMLLMVDIDNFKFVNDQYGHIEGDNILKLVADSLRRYAKEGDVLCRIGGDEFVAFLKDREDKGKMADFAHQFIDDVTCQLKEKGFGITCSISMGIAPLPEQGSSFHKGYNAADKALYFVKQNGKNSFHFFEEPNKDVSSQALVDLRYIAEVMARADQGRQGALLLQPGSFQHVYHFLHRFVERNGSQIQLILFTAMNKDESEPEVDEIEVAMTMMEQAIYNSLRRADISTRYSNRQIVAILVDSNADSSDSIAGRILREYERLYPVGNVAFTYDVTQMS